MNSTLSSPIDGAVRELKGFGKENLMEILRHLTQSIQHLCGGKNRIYLEDLTIGSLSCSVSENSDSLSEQEASFPINDHFFPVPLVYQQKQDMSVGNLSRHPHSTTFRLHQNRNSSFFLMPILHLGRAIGVLCLERSRQDPLPEEALLHQLRKLLAEAAPTLNRARKYHQQLLLARRVDEAKKREAALFMVQSAAQLVDRVALASVLIPVPSGIDGERTMEILASYSKEREAGRLYEEERLINLAPGESLISRFIDRAGVIVDDSLLTPLYIERLADETLQKRYLTENLGLKSLYMVPRYDKQNRRVICLVNYYTKERYQFTSFERDLLDAHAEMAQRVVQEIGDEHLEIQILSEIGDLLQQSGDGLQPFLRRVLSKATQLIGADTGSIALVREFDGGRWLLVEDAKGQLVGAKNRDWMKKFIPPIRVGGAELPVEERSLTGLAAASRRPQIIDDCHDRSGGEPFYLPVTEAIRSEIAVPIIYNDEVLAVICLDSLRPHYFSDEHQRILLIIERMIGHHLSILQKIDQLTSEIDRLRQDVGYKDPNVTSYRLGNIIGNSTKTQEVVTTIQRISPPLCERIAQWHKQGVPDQGEFLGLPSILVTGETGAGKEFLFNNFYSELNRTFRKIFPNRSLALKKTNIAAYTGELTYSELFGHKRGAFTGAHSDRRGILEEAHGGVVFLDEIGDADPKTQVQLLRFLDSGEFIRLGENITRHSQVLLVAGTNRDLRQLIAAGTFREDLYHRLSELIIEVPSLNQRREDIPDLAVHLLGRLFRAYHKPELSEEEMPVLSQKAKNLLSRHHYTGNIRELRSILLRAMLLRRDNVIHAEEISKALQPQSFGRIEKSDDSQVLLTEQLAEEILRKILDDQLTFWTGIFEPYSQQELTRDVVVKLVEKARSEGGTNMPKLALLLRACDPASGSSDEKKRFYRFKNFFYKTVRIHW